MLRCLLSSKENLTGVSTGLTGRFTRPVPSLLHTSSISKVTQECKYGPLRPLFNYASVNFWWPLTRMKLLISQPKPELSSLVIFYSFFSAVAKTRYTSCSTLGDAIYFTLTSELSSSFGAINLVLPHSSCKFSHLRCHVQSLI